MEYPLEPGRYTELQGRIDSLIREIENSQLPPESKTFHAGLLTSFKNKTFWSDPNDNLDEMFKDLEAAATHALDIARRENEPKKPGIVSRLRDKFLGSKNS